MCEFGVLSVQLKVTSLFKQLEYYGLVCYSQRKGYGAFLFRRRERQWLELPKHAY